MQGAPHRGVVLMKKERIRKAPEFRRLYKEGKRVTTDHFVWFYRLGGLDGGPLRRLGITVTRDVGKAHQRNRIKRQVREFFRQSREAFPTGAFVIKARTHAARVKNVDLRGDLAKGLGKILKRGCSGD